VQCAAGEDTHQQRQELGNEQAGLGAGVQLELAAVAAGGHRRLVVLAAAEHAAALRRRRTCSTPHNALRTHSQLQDGWVHRWECCTFEAVQLLQVDVSSDIGGGGYRTRNDQLQAHRAPVWCIMPGLSVVVAGATLPVCRPPVWCVSICKALTTRVGGLMDHEWINHK
jgi:hypothetical protein